MSTPPQPRGLEFMPASLIELQNCNGQKILVFIIGCFYDPKVEEICLLEWDKLTLKTKESFIRE
jgi:hypothetical protein